MWLEWSLLKIPIYEYFSGSLDKIVEDCVSFVGVDLNTASAALLTRIAGLSSLRAKKIIEWREANGAFANRDQLKLVSGLGPKSFEQVCSGLVGWDRNHLNRFEIALF